MTKKRAGSMDQTSSWTFDAAGAPGKLRRSPMASPEPGRMLAFASFQGSSGNVRSYAVAGQRITTRSEAWHDGCLALPRITVSRRAAE